MPLDYPDEFSGNGTVPCPDFGNINNSDATAFDLIADSRVFNLILDAEDVDRQNTVFEKSKDLDR